MSLLSLLTPGGLKMSAGWRDEDIYGRKLRS
jgi:hypothetical protein